MKMKFTKMQGIGNDYVYVDCTKEPLANPGAVSQFVSDRHFGIGADGLILIQPSERADFFMAMYNADGSQGMMCGNGIRCVGKYVYDHRLTDKTTITIDTLSGIKTLELTIDETTNTMRSARVNMGAPILEGEEIPVDLTKIQGVPLLNVTKEPITAGIVKAPMTVLDRQYEVTCVSMGNPHCVVFVDKEFDLKNFKIEEVGPAFEKNEAFPEQINTEFIKVLDENHLEMRVWERGSGETFACGTGACASLVAAVLNGYCNNTATLHLRGGDLSITWDRKEETVYMEGPAATVFEGEIELPAM